MLAWGIVPTNSAKIQSATPESLVNTFHSLVDRLAAVTGLDRGLILKQALITPSCGTGSLPVADAELRVRDTAGQDQPGILRSAV